MLIEIIQDGSDVVANYSGSWATWTRDEAIVVNDTGATTTGERAAMRSSVSLMRQDRRLEHRRCWCGHS